MPHVVVDYSDNLTGLNAKQLLEEINTTLIETELFSPEDIKSRARRDEVFLIGLGVDQAYIHVKAYILSGRTAEQKQLVGEQLLAALSNKKYLPQEFNKEIQLCVELIDMPRDDYFRGCSR
ncbi:Putative 5-carboxymethyl-2-hydroxymuconate delta isomerase [Acinetobacter baumannii]|uniref:5-carboxymethyl-2-hydroxymuconate Delta-isomerase n=1 Tax=Acinetobacter baumannii TaxID=470 RepID=UPI000DE7505C|nr:5-carboxymethyl-2-hydroxymuconate Delta-isomerase [Acinetobacter baumannii]SSM63550.1 Putative 5-carboxymethyl-2-hydroxymuconate delta isomerase [Acinetobacter baumannii]SSP19552.1 Putative 5-carboxymethyl-2-hydroxymuconate delta isomerase [Acinetobacter baumannii]SSP34244.1 Putative 5-carboxymethyl-2-hydroxymuconate delta isomerase [Acinetobacter baumannii]SSP66776.1 Putative 5-carboxymethyl-2-hydroxymuconate delta isomerase [Acinetobacter baumannii]